MIKRMRQSIGFENREQILKDIESLSLEKYVDEIVGAVAEGILRCKTEKDVWSAVEVRVRFSRERIYPYIDWTYALQNRSSLRYIVVSPRPSLLESSLPSPPRLRRRLARRSPQCPRSNVRRRIPLVLHANVPSYESVLNLPWSGSSKMGPREVAESGS